MSDQTLTENAAGRVMVVDDEERHRAFLRDLLEARDHHVTEAFDGVNALEIIERNRPDVILLDVKMPRMNGFDVCKKLKEDSTTAPIPVLLVSALSDRENRLKGIQCGANDFLKKPVDPRDVVVRVRNAVLAKQLNDQLQRSRQQLKELKQERNELTHMIVHDMNSPLTAIDDFLEIVESSAGEKLSERELGYLKRSRQGSDALKQMITTLLDVSRLEAHELPLNLGAVKLTPLVREAAESFRPLYESRELVLDLDDSTVAHCDREIIRRVLDNLLSNACRYTPEDAAIKAQVISQGDSIRVAIIDDGPGIPSEYREEVFRKFGQIDATAKRQAHSAGLGLTFCKLAIEAHGGKVGVDGELGNGSTFWFELPVVPELADSEYLSEMEEPYGN
ncbi:MAG: hybrid sensor histidine kinase/response regulator [Planctomycetota bacterium]|jgi:signal transduction histidine kinase|nr:hybrid sensor histidine kinase/response regulator [Planctomycetota bacterium]